MSTHNHRYSSWTDNWKFKYKYIISGKKYLANVFFFHYIIFLFQDPKVARARDMFFHGDAHFLLYTERYHFFNRKRIKGIRHIVFYQLPIFPHFYYEMCNLMQVSN